MQAEHVNFVEYDLVYIAKEWIPSLGYLSNKVLPMPITFQK